MNVSAPVPPSRPHRLLLGGVPVTVMRPARPLASSGDPGDAPCEQPMLPLGPPDAAPPGPALDLRRAERWVSAVARALQEVLRRQRPVSQLRGVLDDDSLALVAAWTRLGTLHPQAVGAPHLDLVHDDRIEGWFPLVTDGPRLATTITLERRDGRWRCSSLRVLAPAAFGHQQRAA